MAMGEQLLQGSSAPQIIRAIIDIDGVLEREAVADRVDVKVPGLGPIIRDCLHFEKEERHASADIVRQRLEAVADAMPHTEPLKALVRRRLAAEVASDAEERLDSDLGVDNAVTCEPVLRVSRAGQEFACTATEPNGRTHRLVAVLVDGVGSFRLDPG